MVLQSTRWLSLSYFTYFFSYGVFLPFWGIWLQGEGIPPETIGILLGTGLISRFLGSLMIAPSVKDSSHLVSAIRILALLTLICVVGFWFGHSWVWLLMVIAGFNLFFGPLVPLTDALAATWQKQISMDYGKVRLWGSLAFVIGSALTGKLISVWSHPAILYSLIFGVLAMLLGSLLKPNMMPQAEVKNRSVVATDWKVLLSEPQVWRFLFCVTLLQGAHAGYYSFSAIYWQEAGYSAATIGYLWSLGVVAEILVFAFSNVLFRRWTARSLLLLSAFSGIIRWSLMASTTELPWLILIQILHCGSFTVCHLAAMRFITVRRGADVIRLQSVYAALAMGGGLAIMTMISGFLFEYFQGGVFWVMVLIVIPALFIRPRVVASAKG